VTSRSRSIARGAATGLGTLALLLGAVACTGGDEEPPGPEDTRTQEAPDPGGTDPSASEPAASDDGGEATTSPFTEQQLDAASQRFLEALQVLDDQDWEAACGVVLDPTTGTAPEGDRLTECADDVDEVVAGHADLLEPGTFDDLDVSMIEATDSGDGTVAIGVLGEELDIPMAPGEDGRWYLAIPF
jgi:hypothetical protein